jgi:glycosyltransferase involved in cell wall biosynthesis
MPNVRNKKITGGSRLRVTLVIPARNEQANITRVYEEIEKVTTGLPYDFEFITVDNCSTDRTGEMLKDICARDPRWKYIRFSRNFTVEMSITAGYHFASGDAIIVLYSDLQDPPNVIPRFLEKWQEGYDVVYGVRTVRKGDPAWRNILVNLAYRLINWMADIPIPRDSGDFRLISRRVRDELERVEEYNRYMRGLIAWLGFKQIGIEYERQPRQGGKSKAPFWNVFFFTINAITSFSLKPIRMFLLLGLCITGASTLASIVYAYLYFVVRTAPPGITTLIVLSWLTIGLNSLGIGVVGEYVGRTYSEAKRRPLYVIDEVIGL